MSNDSYNNYKVRFQGAIPGSPAEKAGMKFGDIIISVNGIPTPDFAAYAKAVEDRGSCQKMDVIRNGQLIEVVLELNPSNNEAPDYGKIIEQIEKITPSDDTSGNKLKN